MTHGKNITSGPASTPRYDNLTPEHGVACYVTETPLVSPLSVVEHNIAISDTCETFSKTTTQATLMSNKSPTTTSPRVDECITVEEVPARRAAGCASEHTAHAAGQVASVSHEHVSRVSNNKGIARSVVISEARVTIAFDEDARLDKRSMALNGDGRAPRHVERFTTRMEQACLQGLLVGAARATALEVHQKGGILGGSPALALSSSHSPPRLHVVLVDRDAPTGERVTARGAAGLQGLLDHPWCVVVVGGTTPTTWADGVEWRVACDGERADMASGDVTFSLLQTTAHFTFGVALLDKSLIEGLVGGHTNVTVVVVVLSLAPPPRRHSCPFSGTTW